MYLTRHVFMQFVTRKPFGIHAPFLYAFAENCILNRAAPVEAESLDNLRKQLIGDHTLLNVTDFGKGRKFGKKRNGTGPLQYKRSVSDIAKTSLQSPSMCRFLFRAIRYLAPANILELGTSLGITTAYMAMAAPGARVITLEGCPQTAGRAESLFRESGMKNIELRTGPFSLNLETALNDLHKVDLVYIDGDHSYEGVMGNFSAIENHIHLKTVIVLDDIRWSKGMRKAWSEVVAHPRASLAVDMYRLGLVFFDPGLSKQIVPVAF